ncbi:MAG: hypothetical protein ACR2G9_02235 [Gaiellaceae bacterium]
MEKPTLESPRLKLERSRELLNQILTEQTESREGIEKQIAKHEHYVTTLEYDRDGPWQVVRCTEHLPEPPVRWAFLVGDAMHNARSALDHLACRLVERAGKQPSRRTAFPIRAKEPKTNREIETFEAAIKGMSESHKTSIRRLQPYANKSDEARRLLAVAALDNADKHQLLLPRASILRDHPEAPPGMFLAHRWNRGVVLAPGAELFRYKPRGIAGEFVPLVWVTYGDATTDIHELFEIRAYVVGIVESFAPEFG